MRIERIATLLISCIIFIAPAVAQNETPTQVTDQNRTGDLPFSSSVGTDVEHVDLLTGALDVYIPIIKLPGRGPHTETSYHWNSNYFILAMRLTQLNAPYWDWNLETSWGWQSYGTHGASTPIRVQCTDYQGEGYLTGYQQYIYWDARGGQHSLAAQTEAGGCAASTGITGPDLTGQGMLGTAAAYTPTVLLADGSTEATKDSNGNSPFVPAACTPITNGYTCYDSNGTQQTYTVNWESINIATNFQATSGGYGATYELTESVNVISSIVLPNGRQYTFHYNDPYGEITEIDLPTGGAVTYTWTNVKPNQTNQRWTRRAVASRTEWIGGVTNGGVCTAGSTTCSTWNWSYSAVGTYPTYTTTVTYPPVGSPSVSNQSVFVGTGGAITDAKLYAGSATGTPLREYTMVYATDHDPGVDDICWNPNQYIIPSPIAQPVGQRLTSITTILEDGQTQSQKQFDYETFTYTYYPNHCSDQHDNNTSKQYTTSRGNVTEIREYDWGSGGPGSLIRRTDKTYLHNSNSTYLTYNIVNKVLQDTVYDSTSNTCLGFSQPCAQTQYEYDNYVAGANALISTNSTAPDHDYTNYSSTFTYRGNVTRLKQWPNTATGSTPLTTVYTYDDLGNIRAVQDPIGKSTTYSYLDSWSGSSCPVTPSGDNAQAFVALVTDALGHQIKRTYYECSGLLAVHQDQNDINAGRTGTLHSYDWAGRNAEEQDTHLASDGSWGTTTDTYNDIPPVTISTSSTITSSLNKTSISTKDGLGRIIETQLTSDPDGTTEVDTAYDALGRRSTVSNPYRPAQSSSTDGTSTYNYDALSRVISVNEPDGSAVSTSFNLNCTTGTDEAGKVRTSCSDGLGRMTGVWEDPNGNNFETDYGYDALGNLLSVSQKGNSPNNSANWRSRSFTYDGLSRLTSATNPESGQILYSYFLSGTTLCAGSLSAVCEKTGFLQNQTSGSATIITTYAYDSLNRLTGKSYTANTGFTTPPVKYGYDGVALSGCTTTPPSLTDPNPIYQRTAMCDGSGATSWNHDQMDRVTTERRTIVGLSDGTKSISYGYNLDSSMATLTYPGTGKTITYVAGGAGRPTSANDIGGGINYVQGATYAPFGSITGMVIGKATGFNGINVADTYNARLQPLQLYVTTAALTQTTLTQLQALACPTAAATIMSRSYNFAAGATDNGNVQSITNCLDSTRKQTFTYDKFNRLNTAQSSGTGSTSWGEQYTIDAWGNLTNFNSISGKQNSESLTCSPASTKNRLNSCYNYDIAGNLVQNGNVSFTYDAENRLIWSSDGDEYIYDGDGNRVVKCTSGSQSNTCPTGSTGTLYWRYSGGDTIAENSIGGTSLEEYIFFEGKRVARRDVSSNAVHYYFSNHLGSASVVTNANGSSLDEDLDYYPYGGIAPTSTDTVVQNYKFTGKERDSESGLDNFGARYHASSMGRFMTPDPGRLNFKHLLNPQKWNKYAYVLNNPLAYFDPNGQAEVKISFDAFIPQSNVAYIGRGDNRGFSADPNASSRVRVTMQIETDPAKNHGNPLIGKPDVQINTTHNNLTGNNTPAVVVQAPTVTPSQDANGNVNLNVQMNVHSGDLPASTSIRSDVNIGVNEPGTQGSVQGTVSGSPAFEANFTPQGGPTTNLPIQDASSNAFSFTYNLTKTNTVDKKIPIEQAPQQ